MPSSVRVRVPATTANLGPGFDCLGAALQIYNTVTVSAGEGGVEDEMAAGAEAVFSRAAGRPSQPFRWTIQGDVPRSRGLGSSVTVRLGILHGLNALAGSPLSAAAIYRLCAELEGHPDNAAPAAFGGFTVARLDGAYQRFRVSSRLRFVLLIPDFEVKTPDARRVLPAAVPHVDAVRSAGNAAAIAAAFASSNYEALHGCFADLLHQPYRAELIPCLDDVIAAGTAAGALGGWLSGSGSTIACATLTNAEGVATAMKTAAGLPSATTRVTTANNGGVRVTPES